MEAFAYRDGGFASAMSTGEALLLRQLASEVLVVLDDPGDFASTSSMVSAATETEQRREAPRERSLGMLLPPMSEDDEDAEEAGIVGLEVVKRLLGATVLEEITVTQEGR